MVGKYNDKIHAHYMINQSSNVSSCLVLKTIVMRVSVGL